MNRIIKTCLLIWVESSYAVFFHRFSIKSWQQPNTGFGYSLDYQEQKRSLVIGAPYADLDGRVYACGLKTSQCLNIIGPHNLMKNLWGNYSRLDSPNQHFYLGASVAVTPNYVFTCAPALTAYIEYKDDAGIKNKYFKAVGTCFIERDAFVQPYNSTMDSDTFYGAVGWSVVVDQKNDIIIINKPEHGKIMYTSAKNPMQRTVNVNWADGTMNEYISIGRALTKGVFFREFKTVYAFSLEQFNRRGVIAFLHYAENSLQLIRSRIKSRMINIRNGENGDMFGSVLNAADFNQDGYSELLVGAPTQTYKDSYETGAVYIYLGGEKIPRTPRHICITHDKEGSRLGSAIAAADLDDDNLPDLFVSAPYEDGGGAVYVISGFMVRRLLERKNSQCILAKEVYNQRISGSSNSFGFALQPLVNFSENGANGLATGSPSASTVTIYRSIPAVNVTIFARLKDKEIVRELDKNFTVTVEVSVNSSRPNIPADLIVKSTIDQDMGASIDDKHRTFTIDLSLSPTLNITQLNITKDITVNLEDQEPRTYKFVASVETVTSLLDIKEYSESLVRLSEYSVDKYELSIQRRCRGDECMPHLQIFKVIWMDRSPNHYVLGSSQNEIITVAIKNSGNTSYESCAKIKVIGAKMTDWNCYPAEVTDVNSQQQLMCKFAVVQGHKEEMLNINLDMSQTSNKDEKLVFEVILYNKCSSGIASANFNKTIFYQLQTTGISINGSSLGQNVTDRELAENKDSTFDIQDTFIITNNGSVTWKDVQATIILSKESYIQDFTIRIYPEEIGHRDTNVVELRFRKEDFFAHSCSLNLTRWSNVTILTTATILKDKIAQADKLQLSYELQLHLLPTTELKTFRLNSTRTCVKDAQVGTNKTYILIIAIVLAIIVLLILGAILYKFGFFKRTAKEELENLREEARQRSFRSPYYLIDGAEASSSNTQQMNKDASQQDNEVQTNKTKEMQSVKM